MDTLKSIFVSHLKKWDINAIFSVPGKPLAPLMVECDKQGIQYITARHESGAGYEATGYALMNKKLGVAAGTSGPGGTNMLTSVGQAKASYAPVLFITGCPSIRDTGKALGQDSTFFGTDLVEIYKHVTKFSARVERGDLFESYLRHALEKMYSGVKGPVHLSIPYDVFNEQIEEFELDLPIYKPLVSPDLDLFLNKLENCKRPAILAGKGVHASQAYDELLQLAETWNIPVMTTPGGKGVFIENHPLSLGALGLGGTDESEKYVQEGIDLLIVVGSKLSDMSIIGLMPFPKEVVQLDYDITFMQKSLSVTTLPIIGDIKTNLILLLNKVKNSDESKCIVINSNYKTFEDSGSYISSKNAIKIIREELSDDSIIFGDDGSHSYYGIRYFEIKKTGTFFFDDIFGAMGHAIGYSIGAQLVNLNSRIICLTGDGCTMMQGTEISTAVNYNIPVTIIVLNNGRLDMVDKSMKNVLGKSVGAIYTKPLDVKGFAESMGAIAFKCYNEIELRNALKNNRISNLPVVIEVIVDPDEIPPTMKRGS